MENVCERSLVVGHPEKCLQKKRSPLWKAWFARWWVWDTRGTLCWSKKWKRRGKSSFRLRGDSEGNALNISAFFLVLLRYFFVFIRTNVRDLPFFSCIHEKSQKKIKFSYSPHETLEGRRFFRQPIWLPFSKLTNFAYVSVVQPPVLVQKLSVWVYCTPRVLTCSFIKKLVSVCVQDSDGQSSSSFSSWGWRWP